MRTPNRHRIIVSCLFVNAVVTVGAVSAVAAPSKSTSAEEKAAALEQDVTQGALRIVDEEGVVVECPLEHTDVKADISGFIGRVKVTQTFHNPTNERIEAVYVFPLPHEAAVDDMTMVIGDRKIIGLIKRRDEAREIYQQALSTGQTAALLEQERPNIFTQSVGNIEPGQDIQIEISYVDVLKYDLGTYEFHFPLVVGPRYIPGAPTGATPAIPPELQGKVSPPVPNTTRVPDASRISPPVLKPGHRTGHDISLSVSLDAGVPIQNLAVANHKAAIDRKGERKATIRLSPADSLPNKDFVLRYGVVGKKPEMAILAHTGKFGNTKTEDDGYFMLMVQPKEDERLTMSPPREIVFLVDVSGSMSGEPTATVIKAMRHMLMLCREIDTVQVITFAGRANNLFEGPVPVTEESIKRALNFTQGLRGGGGTEMLKGVKLAIDEPIDNERIRIVVMLTDGYIGNEAEIVEHVGKNCGDQIRFWAIGIGSSPNMFLIDGVAKQGGGMGKRLGLKDDIAGLTQEIMTRIQRAQLAKIKIDWGDLQVSETYPARIPELWAGRPMILFGLYSGGGIETSITINGNVEGDPVSWPLKVKLPAREPGHDVLPKVWARRKIEDLMHQTYYQGSPEVEELVTAIALDYRLMSQYTSFVAVDEKEAKKLETQARPPRRMLVPVPLPEGTRWEGFFGERAGKELADLSLGVRISSFSFERPLLRRDAISAGAVATPVLSPLSGIGGGGFGGVNPNGSDRSLSGYFMSLEVTEFRIPKAPSGLLGLDKDVAKAMNEMVTSSDYNASALRSNAVSSREAAQQSLESARELEQKDDRDAAQVAFRRAYFLDRAAVSVHASNGQVAAEALAKLQEIHREQVDAWSKSVPVLDKKMNFILRDKSIEESLDIITKAAGAEIELLPGSVEDAAKLLKEKKIRVGYLDLRHATVAQSLDWILQPSRMNWWIDNDTIVAGTDRRRNVDSAWVYDVRPIAIPSAEELGDPKDNEKFMVMARKAADEFISVVREELKIEDDNSIVWFSPGQLLVFGNSNVHTKAEKLFSDLANPNAPKAGKLHAITSKRAESRKESESKLLAALHRMKIAAIHKNYGWRLLASAAAGELDLEALTELQIAWKDPATAEILDGKGTSIVLRSLWILTESSKALPEEPELRELAKSAVGISRQASRDVLAALEKNPEDAGAFLGVLYGALAIPDTEYATKAQSVITSEKSLESLRTLATALFADPGSIDGKSLIDLVSSEVSGEDMTVLTAIACRRAGGQVWDAFRADSRDLLGDQPLPGSVVVLVNNLANPRLALVADH